MTIYKIYIKYNHPIKVQSSYKKVFQTIHKNIVLDFFNEETIKGNNVKILTSDTFTQNSVNFLNRR